MQDETWLRDLVADEEPEPRRPSPRLLALATLPWLVVLGLLIVPARGVDPPGGDADDHADAEVTLRAHEPEEQPAAPEPTDATDPDAQRAESPPPPRLTVVAHTDQGERAAALATVVARAWVTGIGPLLTIDGTAAAAPTRYAEHLVVESIAAPGPGALVVTILAVVLEEVATEHLQVVIERIAVPLAVGVEGPRPAGTPWQLPGPDLTPVSLGPTTPLQDPSELLAAAAALTEAGITGVELQALHSTTGWPFLAEVAAPDGGGAGLLWLERTAGGFRVTGAPDPDLEETS